MHDHHIHRPSRSAWSLIVHLVAVFVVSILIAAVPGNGTLRVIELVLVTAIVTRIVGAVVFGTTAQSRSVR